MRDAYHDRMPIEPFARPFHADGGPVGVLFCHGFTGSPASLRAWAEATAAAGHTVALPRLPGHGSVWQELNVVTWQDWYDCVDAEYARLAARCDQVFVAGLSMGGSLALRLAQHHPEIVGLILVNPALGAVDPKARLAGLLRHVVRAVPSIGNDIKLEGVDEGAYDMTPVAGVAQLAKLWADVRAVLDLVTCPMLVYRSRTDNVVPASSVETIRRLVSSSDYHEVTLLDSYHVATIDNDAPRIFAGTLDFIERVSADGPARPATPA